MLIFIKLGLKSRLKNVSVSHEKATYQPFNILLNIYLHKINIFEAYY